MRSFTIIKPSCNGEIYIPFTDIGISCSSCDIIKSQTCLNPFFPDYLEVAILVVVLLGVDKTNPNPNPNIDIVLIFCHILVLWE